MNHDDPRSALRLALLEEGFGPIGLCGPRRALPWLPAISASASALQVLASAEEIDALRVFGGDDLGVEMTALAAAPPSEGEPSLAGVIALDWPPGDEPLRALEGLLARVGDRGLCLFDLPVDAAREARLLRLLEGMLTELSLRRGGEGRLVARGLRDAPGRELALEEPEPIDLTVLLYARGDGQGANATALDLLFRQNFPPHLVLVLDDAAADETPVPEDLWGMAPHAQTQPGLLRCGGAGRGAALARAFEHVETEALVWVEAGDRLAANLGGALVATLFGDEEADFAHAAAWVDTARGPAILSPPPISSRALVGAWMRGPRPPLAALAWRVEDEGQGASPFSPAAEPPASREAFTEALAMDLALHRRGAACSWPLVRVAPLRSERSEAETAERRRLRRRLRAELETGRLALLHEAEPRSRRRELALCDRARYLAEVGDWDGALEDLDAAGVAARPAALLGVAWELRREDRAAARRRAIAAGAEGSLARGLLGEADVPEKELGELDARILRLHRGGVAPADLAALVAEVLEPGDPRQELLRALV